MAMIVISPVTLVFEAGILGGRLVGPAQRKHAD
jgi:hypothetical protein